ncbi:uncharacterized protein BN779_01588 [Succinatimonas sp. CAG:777]|nr:uncharacterized protein BN779_01588 [Succinatimonas sp. CAG:777]
MAEKIAELVPTSNGCSIVLKSNSFSNDLMVSTGLDLTFFDPNGSTELKRVSLKPEEIGFDNNGFSAPLPPEINNELAQKVNSFGGKFKVKALEYDPVSLKTVGDPAYFDASVTGTLKVIQDYVKKEGESINAATFNEKKEPTFTEDKATVDEIKSSDAVLNEAATATTTTVATKSSGKGKILAIIGAIILLLFILGLLALFLAGFFGGSKDNSSNANEPTPKEQTEETNDNSAKDDNAATEDNSQSDNTASDNSSSDNTTEPQDNEPAQTEPNVADNSAATASSVCVITSDPDNVMIKNCIASKPDSATVSAFAKDAFSKDKCDLGKRLFSSYGRKDGTVAYTYGQYFDPNSQETTSCASKDKNQAVYWYEKAAQLGNDNAKSALSALKN